MKVLIADDHELFLKGLEMILQASFPEMELKTAKDYQEIFNIIANEHDFDLVLTDLAMPGAKWLDAIEKIHTVLPNTPIIILSAVFDKEIVQKTIELGAAGYVPKTSSNAVIISAVNLVMSGGVYIPPELLHHSSNSEFALLKQIEEKNIMSGDAKVLSPRQIDVLRLIAKGRSNKQIAYDLGLTEGTVKLHVTAILKLLNVYNRTGAVAEANRQGILK
ncbi:MAG: response regulator transcription factor [Alphaproteobacteria bacterium]|nr:response regulator transcription factor [Alphaproteobacteria bacterium]MBQ7285917.1 response regulator transcription factor [Alphaproteobacteria bacterium]